MSDNRNLQITLSSDDGVFISNMIAFIINLQNKHNNVVNLDDMVKMRKIDNKIFDALVQHLKENKIEN
jgi:hypothetical protein